MIESSVVVNPKEVLVNPGGDALTFDLDAGALTMDLEADPAIDPDPDAITVNPDAEVLTFDLDAEALTFDLEADHPQIGSDPDAITINPDVDAVVVKYEYIIVDAEKQTSRCAISTSPVWKW